MCITSEKLKKDVELNRLESFLKQQTNKLYELELLIAMIKVEIKKLKL